MDNDSDGEERIGNNWQLVRRTPSEQISPIVEVALCIRKGKVEVHL